MQVHFTLTAPDGVTWSEDEIAGFDDAMPEMLAPMAPLYGTLVITDADQDDRTAISDDFDMMMRALCLRGVVPLFQGRDLTYAVAAHPETVNFRVLDDRVVISGDATPQLYCDRAGLVAALLDCGARFVALKRLQLGPEGAAAYQADLETAQTALGRPVTPYDEDMDDEDGDEDDLPDAPGL